MIQNESCDMLCARRVGLLWAKASEEQGVLDFRGVGDSLMGIRQAKRASDD